MAKLLFFNRIPIIDGFVCEIIGSKVTEITVVRTVIDLRSHFDMHEFDYMLLNVDDRLKETDYLTEIMRAKNLNTRVIVFGQYQEEAPALVEAGVTVFLTDDLAKEDFECLRD